MLEEPQDTSLFAASRRKDFGSANFTVFLYSAAAFLKISLQESLTSALDVEYLYKY